MTQQQAGMPHIGKATPGTMQDKLNTLSLQVAQCRVLAGHLHTYVTGNYVQPTEPPEEPGALGHLETLSAMVNDLEECLQVTANHCGTFEPKKAEPSTGAGQTHRSRA